MIERALEPEAMDTMEDSLEYDAMDFSEVNTAFAERAVELIPERGVVLDLGTGTARVPLLMLERNPNLTIIAVDLSETMLKVGKLNVEKTPYTLNVILQKVDAKQLPFLENYFDAVISNSLLHHIPDPAQVLIEIKRVAKPNAGILIRDLIRPDTNSQVETLVELYAGDCDDHQKKLYRDSLNAAFTLSEVEELVRNSGLKNSRVVRSSDRHWSIEKDVSRQH
jgi:ubiquinone/menaquinone biosynthesis C-methylase UbiE